MRLDVRGDVTYVFDADRRIGLVRPDQVGAGSLWSSWTPSEWDESGWAFSDHHPTRGQALAALGYDGEVAP